MRSLIVAAFVTLDGVMQAPGGPDEDPTGGFTQGGWAVNYFDEAMNSAIVDDTFGGPFDLLLGRKTYDIFAADWPAVLEDARSERGGKASDVDDPVAVALNEARKYVASRTTDTLEWNNSFVLDGDVAEAVAELRKQDGPPIVTQGSTELIQTLLTHNLVDEFRVWTFPIVVGDGKRLFGPGAIPAALELVEVKTSTTGVVMATYRPSGEIDLGSFEFDVPTDEELARRERLGSS